jgi:transposase
MREDAPQRDHALRDVFDGLGYLVRTGAPWRYLPALGRTDTAADASGWRRQD